MLIDLPAKSRRPTGALRFGRCGFLASADYAPPLLFTIGRV
jgi:hypothetical protein